ncbi:prepilin-type N-terminal cleavage/methylation domain-containing protein [Candidatus Microgenomates bacterium]|jgi:general secretion pathway protein G|nr:MAG: prepilin-type N-terminal cleavage/methylation domain-containing protein [Candidatus Microgenomates bacterium]
MNYEQRTMNKVTNKKQFSHRSLFNVHGSKSGFTLIELLVVIAILGILTTLLISNVAGARERARDSKRKADLKEIKNALEMYKQDNNSYPDSGWSEALQSGDYMKSVPVDPLDSSDYIYDRNDTNSLMYTLKACLENASDPDGIADSSCESGFKYEVTEP